MRSNSPSISARAMTGIWSALARATSGLENLTADEITTAQRQALRDGVDAADLNVIGNDDQRDMVRMMALEDFHAQRAQPLGGGSEALDRIR